mmetsp:Transcript_5238/g.6216  ORF Transcript_5238/g.6216 Transcript_5238/m.6216 type:complete len:491 (+) Transcript_5238:21-1493(+)
MARKINMAYLGPWMAVVAIGMFQFGFSIAMFNIFTKSLFLQYQHDDKEVISNIDDFNSAVTTIIPVGAVAGAFTGGILSNLGRRFAIFIVNAVIVVGVGLTMIYNFWALMGGRLLIGYGVGTFTVISPLFISETSPEEVAGSLGAINQFMVTAGIMIADILGFAVPYAQKEGEININGEVYTSQVWRIVFAIPGGIAIIQTILLLLIFRYDTPKFYKQNQKYDMASKVDSLIYKSEASSGDEKKPDSFDLGNTPISGKAAGDGEQERTEKVPVLANLSPRYRTAFAVGCLLALFQQLTGINAVIFYSNDIFTRGKQGYDSEHAAKIGTMLVGVVNWATAMMAIPLLRFFGRKLLLIGGQIGMGVSLLLLAIFAITDSQVMIKVLTLFFVGFFEFSIGPILWLYAAEIMTETGMAAASLITWIITIVFGLFTSKLFDLLTPEGMYFTFTGIDVVGFLFIIFFIKETKGKTKKEIEYLYVKGDYKPLSTSAD